MKSIESYMFYGDNAEVFRPLIGFKIEDIEFTNTNEEKEPVIILGCVNERHVRIDLLLQEDGVFVSEPYAFCEQKESNAHGKNWRENNFRMRCKWN